jgi:HSP20 family protein
MATHEKAMERPRANARSSIQRSDPHDMSWSNPFAVMRRMQDELDRWFRSPRATTGWMPSFEGSSSWAPAIDVFQRGNELVVRADMPGMSKDDIEVEIGEDALTIRGERRREIEEEREGVFRSERSYGSFCRVVALPDGTIADNAKASFKDGVLEVVMPAPSPEVKRGRRIEISGAGSRHEEGGKK